MTRRAAAWVFRSAAFRRIALLLALLTSCTVPVRAGGEPLFDPVTGYRVLRFRAPVHEPPPGSTRISIADLDRLVRDESAVLVDVMPAEGGGPDPLTGEWRLVKSRENIPGSVWLPDVGRGALSAEMDAYFRRELARLTAGDPMRPVVLYCQSDCWMAWNAGRRAAGYGYSRLYWYPEGSDGWRDHDRALVPAVPVPVRLSASPAR